jgi:hypothetical protein
VHRLSEVLRVCACADVKRTRKGISPITRITHKIKSRELVAEQLMSHASASVKKGQSRGLQSSS